MPLTGKPERKERPRALPLLLNMQSLKILYAHNMSSAANIAKPKIPPSTKISRNRLWAWG
jgi:hypothetical protein